MVSGTMGWNRTFWGRKTVHKGFALLGGGGEVVMFFLPLTKVWCLSPRPCLCR